MMLRSIALAGLCALLVPAEAQSCDGPSGGSVALTTDGHKYTVTNVGRQPLQVTFGAFGASYSLQLAPGQSGTPISSGVHQQYMSGYQTCYAATLAPTPIRPR